MELTERDIEILRHVGRHRFLRSTHILDLVPGSRQNILRRLQLLFHNGYLERPRAQVAPYHWEGTKPFACCLGKKGAELLLCVDKRSYVAPDLSAKSLFLDHALMVSEILVSLEKRLKDTETRFVFGDELIRSLPPHAQRRKRPFAWNVAIPRKTEHVIVSVQPDAVFALRSASGPVFYFLEADRGTMPIKRKTLDQTSLYRKLLAYSHSWERRIPAVRLGILRFRVLILSYSESRVGRINILTKQIRPSTLFINYAHGQFLTLSDPTRLLLNTS